VVAIPALLAAAHGPAVLLDEPMPAVVAADKTRQQGVRFGAGTAPVIAAARDRRVRSAEQRRVHQRLVRPLDDEPVIFGVVVVARVLLRAQPAVAPNAVDLAHRAPVPCDRPAVRGVLDHALDLAAVPASAIGSGDALLVQPGCDRMEALPARA